MAEPGRPSSRRQPAEPCEIAFGGLHGQMLAGSWGARSQQSGVLSLEGEGSERASDAGGGYRLAGAGGLRVSLGDGLAVQTHRAPCLEPC